MVQKIGRNVNTNDEAVVDTIEINSVNAVTIAAANPTRTALIVSLDAGITDIDAFIRLYPAADDNDLRGILLARRLSGNDNLFAFRWEMSPDNIYTGEISAISTGGTFDIHVTEY